MSTVISIFSIAGNEKHSTKCGQASNPFRQSALYCRWHIDVEGKVNNPCTSLDRPLGFQEVEGPRFQDSRHLKVVRSALCTGRLYPKNYLCYRLSWPQGHSAAGRIMSLEIPVWLLAQRPNHLHHRVPRHIRCMNYHFSCVRSTDTFTTVSIQTWGSSLREVAFKETSFHSVEPGVYYASNRACWKSLAFWWSDGSGVAKLPSHSIMLQLI